MSHHSPTVPAPPPSVITQAVAAALRRPELAAAPLAVAWARTALRKRVAEFRLAAPGDAEVIVVGKVYTKPERGAAAHALLDYLWASGFDAGQFTVARPIAWLREWNMLLVGKAAGIQLLDRLLLDPADATGGAVAARWLERLHAVPAPDFLPQRDARAAEGIGRFAAELLPALARDARPLLEALLGRLDGGAGHAARAVLLHGDFHPQNVFVDGEGPGARVSAIDVDHARVGDPAWDVGYLIGQMRVAARERLGDPTQLDRAATAAREQYLAGLPVAERHGFSRRVARFEALTLVESLHYRRCILHLPPEPDDAAILRLGGGALDAAA